MTCTHRSELCAEPLVSVPPWDDIALHLIGTVDWFDVDASSSNTGWRMGRMDWTVG